MEKEGKLILFFSFCRSQRSSQPTKMLQAWEANTRSFKLFLQYFFFKILKDNQSYILKQIPEVLNSHLIYFSKILKDNKSYVFFTWVF